MLSPLWVNLGPNGQTWGLINSEASGGPPFPVDPAQPVLCVVAADSAQAEVVVTIENCANASNEGQNC
jgi:hypothetical protein